MKFYIILVCAIVAQAQGQDMKAALTKAVNDCIAKTKADPAEAENLRQHKPITTPAGKCFVACINRVFKIQDETGALDAYATREALKALGSLTPEIYHSLVNIGDICLVEVDEKIDDDAPPNECEVASQWHDCVIRESNRMKLPLWLAEI